MNIEYIKKSAFLLNALFLLGLLLIFPQNVFANDEFKVEQYNAFVEQEYGDEGSKLPTNVLFDVQNTGNSLIASTLDVGFDILALIFIFGVIGIGAGFTLQNGQWTKWSTGAMYGTFLAIIFLRIVPILVLTIDQIGITLVINHVIQMFAGIGFFIAILMFLIGLFLRSLHKIFEHPRYFRWGRSLLFGSVIIMTLSTVSPFIIMSL